MILSLLLSNVLFEYVPVADRRVSFFRDGYLVSGKLEPNGDFRAERRREGPVVFTSGPFTYEPIGNGSATPESVYEFRYGKLVPGHLLQGGEFVCERGATISSIQNYDPRSRSRRIWNLPGVFRPVFVSRRPDAHNAALAGAAGVTRLAAVPVLTQEEKLRRQVDRLNAEDSRRERPPGEE